jgi:hypothetical protein
MIDPEQWRALYQADPTGRVFASGPGAWPRWVYMLGAGVAVGGVLMLWLGRSVGRSEASRIVLRTEGKRLTIAGTVLALVAGYAAWAAQPTAVRDLCSSADPVWMAAAGAWALGAVGVLVLALALGDGSGWKKLAALSGAAALQTAGFVVARDLVRDASLGLHGFDVWDRAVAVNWSVLVLFFVLFVAGLGVVGWLTSVAWRATPAGTKEEAA